MPLYKIYIRSVIYPSILLVILMAIFLLVDNPDYQSEWMTPDGTNEFMIVIIIIYDLIVCALSLTLFLNKYKKINSSLLLSGLTWFLLPAGFTVGIIGKSLIEYLTTGTDEIVYSLVLNIPFIIGLTWGFVKYRRTLNNRGG